MREPKFIKYDWPTIQKDYDTGLGWREIQFKYGLTVHSIQKAIKNNLFISRSKSEGTKMGIKRFPRICSVETRNKISISRKKFLLENPDKVPYLLNHVHKKKNYAEEYFFNCLQNTNFVSKYRILNYELDFADIEFKIDLEIDGDQHFVDKRIIEHDKQRNQKLIELGWTIYRVRWSEFQKQSFEQKKFLISSIINKNPIDVKCFIKLDAQPHSDKISEYLSNLNIKGYNKCLCGEEKWKTSKLCIKCYKQNNINNYVKKLPKKEELEMHINSKPLREIGNIYNVSSKTIKKWCKLLEIQIPSFPCGYWQKRNQGGLSHEEALL